jgi:hypothetical protein
MEKKIPLSDDKKKEAKQLLDRKYKEESRLVKGVFKNIEAPGGELEFPMMKYPQDPCRMYTFKDGETYEVPLYVANHINKDCNEGQHLLETTPDGKKVVILGRGRQRFQFIPLEF